MRYREIVEAPIADFEKIGGGNDADIRKRFHPADDKLLSSPKAVQKITNAFARTPFDFNIYILMPSEHKRLGSAMGFDVQVTDLERIVGRPVETEGRITVVFTNNVTGANAMPMTGWTLAHRMGHAIQVRADREKGDDPALKNVEVAVVAAVVKLYNAIYGTNHVVKPEFLGVGIMSSYTPGTRSLSVEYDGDCKHRFLDLLTMKSARDKKFNVLGIELFCELLAQYLLTGGVRLKVPEAKFARNARAAEKVINKQLETLLQSLVGTVVSF